MSLTLGVSICIDVAFRSKTIHYIDTLYVYIYIYIFLFASSSEYYIRTSSTFESEGAALWGFKPTPFQPCAPKVKRWSVQPSSTRKRTPPHKVGWEPGGPIPPGQKHTYLKRQNTWLTA